MPEDAQALLAILLIMGVGRIIHIARAFARMVKKSRQRHARKEKKPVGRNPDSGWFL